MQSTLTYRFDPDDDTKTADGTLLEAVRLTVKSMTMRQVGAQARMAQEATDQWRTDNGLKLPDDAPPGTVAPEPTPEMIVTYNAMMKWTVAAAATCKVQIVKRGKKIQELDLENPDGWPWQDSSMSAMGWDQPASVLDVKTDMLEAWDRAAQTVNPGTFGRPLTSAAKKTTGVISVT